MRSILLVLLLVGCTQYEPGDCFITVDGDGVPSPDVQRVVAVTEAAYLTESIGAPENANRFNVFKFSEMKENRTKHNYRYETIRCPK